MRSSAEIKADIVALRIAIGVAAYDDAIPDMQDDLQSLLDELDEAEAALPIPDKHAPTGGLDLVKVAKAFGAIPKDWDEGFLP